jgi:xylulose-5-phosphate/fructose-6-phosphate phosphoketolase
MGLKKPARAAACPAIRCRSWPVSPATLVDQSPCPGLAEKYCFSLLAEIRRIQSAARSASEAENPERPRWPMIVFQTPKGWTGPKFVDGKRVEGTWRAHQVPIADFKNPEHLKQLEEWMRSYRPQDLFDENGKFREELAALAPTGRRRMGANPRANGGELLAPLSMPHFRDYAVEVTSPGRVQALAAHRSDQPFGKAILPG